MQDKAYHTAELARLARDLRSVETAPLRDRQEARAEWVALLRNPVALGARASWLLDGAYGYGAMIRARETARNRRMNRAAGIGQLLAVLECRCPSDFARATWRRLTPAQRAAANATIMDAIQDFLAEEAATH